MIQLVNPCQGSVDSICKSTKNQISTPREDGTSLDRHGAFRIRPMYDHQQSVLCDAAASIDQTLSHAFPLSSRTVFNHTL